MSNPQPALTGTLESTPLVNLLVYALEHRLTGTLVLEQDDGRKHAVYLDDGAPAKVRLADPGVFLGEVLVLLGKLTPAQNASTFDEAVADERLHGNLLVERGLIDEATLRDALREQVGRKLERLAALEPSTVWGYYEHINYLERYGSSENIRAKPLALIWQLVQKHVDRARVEEVIARVGARTLRLHHDAPILRFRFGRHEQAVIEVLRAKPQPLAELLARELVEAERLKELVYMLAVTRQLELGSPDVAPLGSSEPPSSSNLSLPPAPPAPPADTFRRPSPAPGHGVGAGATASAVSASAMSSAANPAVSAVSPVSPAVSAEAKGFLNEVQEHLAKTDENYYELLGVAPNADANTIHESYLRLAKRWHPDRLGPEHADVREAVTRIFARMSEAQQTLCDPDRRKVYDKLGADSEVAAEEAEHVQRVLRAATAFQRAEILLKRGNLVQAEEEARKAIADDASQPEYRALLAWLEAQKPGADLAPSIAVLDRVLTQSPNDLRARWYRGQLHKRSGKDNKAIRDFRAIVEQDPRHVDAQREIRLYDMRNTGGKLQSDRPSDKPVERTSRLPPDPKATGASGLFNRFFKK